MLRIVRVTENAADFPIFNSILSKKDEIH